MTRSPFHNRTDLQPPAAGRAGRQAWQRHFYFGAAVHAWGGRGDDLFQNPGQNFHHPELYPLPRRSGRAGRGTLIIWRGYSADQIITDFLQGEGRLALNAGTLHRQQLRRDSGVFRARGVSDDP